MPSSRARARWRGRSARRRSAGPVGHPPSESADAGRGGPARAQADPHAVAHLAAAAAPAAAHARSRDASTAGKAMRRSGRAGDPPGIAMIDTLLGGGEEVTAVYLVRGGGAAAMVDTGARTSAPRSAPPSPRPGSARRPALDRADPRPSGPLRRRRGSSPTPSPRPGRRPPPRRPPPHRPGRLVAGTGRGHTGAVVPVRRARPDRGGEVEAARTGTESISGAGGACGWSRRGARPAPHGRAGRGHRDAVAGDALGAEVPRSGGLPGPAAPDVDLAAGERGLEPRSRALGARVLCPSHFGPVPDPPRRSPAAPAARPLRGVAMGPPAVTRSPAGLEERLPMAGRVSDPRRSALLAWLGWHHDDRRPRECGAGARQQLPRGVIVSLT